MMGGTAVEIDAPHGDVAAEEIFCHLRPGFASDGVDVLQEMVVGRLLELALQVSTLIGNKWPWIFRLSGRARRMWCG